MKIKKLLLIYCFGAFVFSLSAVTDYKTPSVSDMIYTAEQVKLKHSVEFADADDVTLYSKEHYTYDENGLGKNIFESYSLILTDKGRKNNNTFSHSYHAFYEKIVFDKIEIISPDGKVRLVDIQKNAKVTIDSSGMTANIYDPNHKKLSVSIPNLQVGDIVYAKLSVQAFRTRTPGQWQEMILMQGYEPVLHQDIIVDAPEKLPLKSICVKDDVSNNVRHFKERGNGMIRYCWQVGKIGQIIPEPNMPGIANSAQRLLISTWNDWKEISRWYYKICKPHLKSISNDMRKKTAELIKHDSNDEKKLRHIFDFVSKEVRYLGIINECNAPGYEPHDVKDTFERRHGVCRDKAALLASMFELAGFQSCPVLIYAGKLVLDNEVPLTHFNHAVTAVKKGDKYLLFDPTNENTGVFLPSYEDNCSFLVATECGETLQRTAVTPAEQNAVLIRTKMKLDGNFASSGSCCIEFSGINDAAYRDFFASLDPSMSQSLIKRMFNTAMPGINVYDWKIYPPNVRDTSQKLILSFRFFSTLSENVNAAIVPVVIPDFDKVIGLLERYIQRCSLQNRKYKYLFPFTCMSEHYCELELGKIHELVSLPSDFDDSIKGIFETKRIWKKSDNKLTMYSIRKISGLEVDQQNYIKLRNLIGRENSLSQACPIVKINYRRLSNTQLNEVLSLVPSIELLCHTKINLQDMHNWEEIRHVRRRIMNYSGEKDEAEIMLPFSPYIANCSVSGRVFTPDGKVQKLEEREINVMDAHWNGSAPRYKGDKILVAAFPGIVPGSEIEYTLKIKHKNRIFFSHTEILPTRSPRQNFLFEVEMPEKLKLQFREKRGLLSYSFKKLANGRVLHAWSADLIPNIEQQCDLPPDCLFLPSLSMNVGGYEQLSKAMLNKIEQLLQQPAPTVDKTIKTIMSQTEKMPEIKSKKFLHINSHSKLIKEKQLHEKQKKQLQAVRNFIALNIRKAGNGLQLWNMTTPEETLLAGYGNSADRAILLMAFLRRIGIKYSIAVASSYPCIKKTCSYFKENQTDIFDRMLVVLPEFGIFMNDSGQYDEYGAVDNAGTLILQLGTNVLGEESVRPYLSNHRTRHFEIEWKENGSALCQVTTKYFGSNASEMRRISKEFTPLRLRQFFEKEASQIVSGAVLQDDYKIKCNMYPVESVFTVRIQNFAMEQHGLISAELPQYKNFMRALKIQDQFRKLPLWQDRELRIHYTYRIHLPRNIVCLSHNPANNSCGSMDSNFFRDRRIYFVNDNSISIDCYLYRAAQIVSLADYSELLELQRYLGSILAQRLVCVRR